MAFCPLIRTLTSCDCDCHDLHARGVLREASEDADRVIAVGFVYGESVATVAADFPDVLYVVFDGFVEADRVAGVTFAAHEGSFLVGAAAAVAKPALEPTALLCFFVVASRGVGDP